MNYWKLYLSFLLLSGSVSARQVLLNTEKVNLSPYCEKALSAEPVGIKQGINLTYKPVGTESLILPFTDQTIWFRVTVLGDSTQSRILEWENNLSEQVTFFIPDSSGGFREYSGGSFTPYSERSYESTGLSAVFQLKKGVPVTLYVRVQSQRACYTKLWASTTREFEKSIQAENVFDAFFDGMFLIKVLYAFIFAFFLVKNKAFRYFAIHTFLIAGTVWGLDEYIGKLFTSDPKAAAIINALPYHILPVTYVLVTRGILPVKEIFPRWVDVVLSIFLISSLVLSVLLVFHYHYAVLNSIVWLLLVSELFVIALFAVAFFRKVEFNKLFAFTFILSFIGYIFLQIRLLGFIDFEGIVLIVLAALVADILTFVFFIGDMVKASEKERNKAEQAYFLKQQEAEKIREMADMKSRFFTNISHEFRTPLTLLTGPLNDLIRKFPDEWLLSAMKRNVSRLQILINQLLDLSKLEAGQLPVKLSQADLVTFFNQNFAAFESLAASKNVSLHLNQNKASCEGVFDSDKLEKIVTNLLLNAIKFSQENAEVTGEVKYDVSFFELTVSDNGPGIAPEKLPFIFERFYQTEAHEAEGNGIGLALVKELVSVLRGEIQVSSIVNEGTRFMVRIPFDQDSWKDLPVEQVTSDLGSVVFHEQEPTDSQEQQTSSDHPVLLIVEDNPDMRGYVRRIFEGTYEILEAADGKAGLVIAAQRVPDVIISDLMMPEMSGLELCGHLKQDIRCSHVPVILLTAKSDRESKLEGLETGADDYLIKPFDRDELELKVRNLLARQELIRQKFIAESSAETPDFLNETESKFIRQLNEIIDNNLDNSGFGTLELCDRMNLSRATLHRKLKALTSQSASEYIRNFRLQRAAHMLGSKDATVSEVAFAVGFESLSYFSKVFGEKYGKMPSEW